MVPKEIEDHKIVKQVSRDALPVVIQDTVKCDFCHKAFFANIVMACHGFEQSSLSLLVLKGNTLSGVFSVLTFYKGDLF